MPLDKARFTVGLQEFLGMCMDAGLRTHEMIGPMKAELARLREDAMPSVSDDKHNSAKVGLAPMTEADARKLLELEPYEPLPQQRP